MAKEQGEHGWVPAHFCRIMACSLVLDEVEVDIRDGMGRWIEGCE